ncbi:MAG: hypothetical protein AB7N71_09870 [Phycisphaerae bacterium]
MTSRERVLAIGVVGTIGVWGSIALAKKLIIQPFDQQKKNIENAYLELDELENKRDFELRDVAERYMALTSQTLAANNEVAMRRFREDINSLLEKHGFSRGELTVKAQSISETKDGTAVLPVSISAKGKLKETVALLLDLYRRNYMLRVETVNLTAEQESAAEKKKRGGRPEPEGPDLNISLVVSTITLPKLSHPTLGDIPVRPLPAVAESETPSLARELSEYDRIAATNIFAEYVPPPPPPPVREEQQEQVKTEPVVVRKEDPKPPPVDPRKDAGNFRLVGATSLRGEPAVYIKDTTSAESAEPYRLNDEIDDGVLLLVTPRGMVVRSTKGKDAGKDFVYKLGGTYLDREELDPREHPSFAAELKLALRSE